LGKSGKLWLRDFLPHQIPPSRIFLFAYNANPAFSSGNEGVYEQPNNLLVKLLVERDESPDRPLIFICHSLGGLIVKRAIVQAQQSQTYQQLGKSVRGLVFFGTPHRGGKNADLGDVAASIAYLVLRTPANSYLEALKSNNFFAEALRHDFRNRQDDLPSVKCPETIQPRSVIQNLGIHPPNGILPPHYLRLLRRLNCVIFILQSSNMKAIGFSVFTTSRLYEILF